MIGAASPALMEYVVQAITFSGVFMLVYLLVRHWRKNPLLPQNPAPFRRVDAAGLFLLACGTFLLQGVAMILMGVGGSWRLVGILFALNVGIVVTIYGVRRATRPIGSVRFRAYQGAIVAWATLPLVYGTLALVTWIVGYEQQQESVTYLQKPGWPYWAFFVVVVAPLLEEIAFRGLLYPAIRSRFGVRAAVIVTSICFGLVHVQANVVVPLAVLGVSLAYLVETTGSIVPCIVAHGLFNALTVAQAVLQ